MEKHSVWSRYCVEHALRFVQSIIWNLESAWKSFGWEQRFSLYLSQHSGTCFSRGSPEAQHCVSLRPTSSNIKRMMQNELVLCMYSCITHKATAIRMEATISPITLGGVKWRCAPLLRYWRELRATCMEQAMASRKHPADSAHAKQHRLSKRQKCSRHCQWGRRTGQKKPNTTTTALLTEGQEQSTLLWAQKMQTAWLVVYPGEKANTGFCVFNPVSF